MDSFFNNNRRTLLFLAFFLSGFCGLLYQTIWLRLAFAQFGVITPVVSIIVSVFMLGLGIGSLVGGKLVAFLKAKSKQSALLFYAICELIIGCGAFIVPQLFVAGSGSLSGINEANSFNYLFSSAMVMTFTILPWCICMGLTIPFVMDFVSEFENDPSSFSFLYLANVMGAVVGILMTALVLIEFFGFRGTLGAAAVCNFLIAGTALLWNRHRGAQKSNEQNAESVSASAKPFSLFNSLVLFTTGFSSIAMEVVWTRAFSPVMGTEVYAFARLVAVYLIATVLGSYLYRSDLKKSALKSTGLLLCLSAITALFAVIFNDARLSFLPNITRGTLEIFALVSIAPFSAVLGYLTPKLIDDFSAGDAIIAGRAYALNILGSIIGPVLAGYLLLPVVGSKTSLIFLTLPLILLAGMRIKDLPGKTAPALGGLIFLIVAASFGASSYEEGGLLTENATDIQVRRDHTGTVISCTNGKEKYLLVNGTHMTVLTQLAKYDAHLPLVMHKSPPKSALVICFGMGTTYRSLLSWDIDITAVELVPSVAKAFTYYHPDAAEVLKNPKGKIVIDDGRRYLNRTNETYDVITIDPPPPETRAGSSLLYSAEFYQELKQHLKPDGILQQWVPGGDDVLRQAAVRSLTDSFKYIWAFPSMPWIIDGKEGHGMHFLCSNEDILHLSPLQFLQRLPQKARIDLCEWMEPGQRAQTVMQQLQFTCLNAQDAHKFLFPEYDTRITDDHPFNEYYILRNALLKRR